MDVYSAYGLDQGLEEILGDVSVLPFPSQDSSGRKPSWIRRGISKIFCPGTAPLAGRISETNYNTKRALFAMASVIRDQQNQIDELYEALRTVKARQHMDNPDAAE